MSPRAKDKNKSRSVSKTTPSLPVLHPHAAGIDIGAREIYVAMPPDRDPKPVRVFATFTDDLHALRDWLKGCGVLTVAMESTGVYWIPLFQILEAAGIEVSLVNARHCKNLPGRKTDVQDCQWLQYLHAVGLLRGSFRPPETVCAVRTLLRHRDGLLRAAATSVNRLHKALTQMNVQLQHIIADITGVTGLAILEAILAGERDPVALAKLKDGRIKASTDMLAKSLHGDWRDEHLFTLRQTLATWKHYQAQMTACDEESARLLKCFADKVDVVVQPLPTNTIKHKAQQKNAPRFEAREELYRTCGVDLTQVPGIQTSTALVLVAELGPDFAERFPTARHFGSWLGLCPDNRITGGKIMSSTTRDVKSRAATALRLAAQSLWHSKDYLGECYRRWKARLGTPKAITAMAHKLARVLWHMFKYREAFNPEVFRKEQEKMQRKKIARLHNAAAAFGLKLIPNQ